MYAHTQAPPGMRPWLNWRRADGTVRLQECSALGENRPGGGAGCERARVRGRGERPGLLVNDACQGSVFTTRRATSPGGELGS